MKRALAAIAVIGLTLAGTSPAMAAWTLNLREGVTELSREIYGLHMLILWVCVAIAVAVVDLIEGHTLALHLAPDAVDVLGPA
jgi:cytochrome c oxidase subunit 2